VKPSDVWTLTHANLVSEPFHGAPLGNGDLGALLMANHKRITLPLCKSDVWDERCDDGSGKSGSFYPFRNFAELQALINRKQWKAIDEGFQRQEATWSGKFCLMPTGSLVMDTARFEKEIEILQFGQSLDMASGLATAECVTRVRRQTIEALVSQEHEVLALRVRCRLEARRGTPARAMAFGMDLTLPIKPKDPGSKVTSGTARGVLWRRLQGCGGVDYTLAMGVEGAAVRTGKDAGEPRLTVTAGSRAEFVVYVALVSSRDSRNAKREALARVRRAAAAGYAAIRSAHVRQWRRFWGTSRVEIPDGNLLRQYHFGLYLLGSSSRRGFPMPGLQGLWSTKNTGSGWNDYTNDLNIQMNYWPVYASNHLELAWPYYDTVRKWLPETRRYTRRYWGCAGVQFSCCASPTGLVPPAYLTTMHWAGHAAFVAQNFWTHYRYSRDPVFLREVAYPFLKECAGFYLDFLKKDRGGRYVIGPSNMPEAGEGSYEAWGRNPAMDVALVRMLFGAVIESAAILEVDADFAGQCRERLDHFPDYPERNGHLIEMESKEFLYSHRHPGLLTPIYPCSDIGGKRAERSIDRYIAKGRWLWCGFSPVWVAAACARVGRGGQARDLLREFMEVYTHRQGGFNLNFDFAGDGRGSSGGKCFTNETNSGFSASLLEMLLQSQAGVLRVFPAIPRDWPEVEFRHLRAEGAFLVSAVRRGGLTREVRIRSERGGPLRLADPWGGRVLTFETRAGQTLILRPPRARPGKSTDV
jgi:alpha-L-fucosidase 2